MLIEGGLLPASQAPALPTGVEQSAELQEIYRRFGGLQDAPSLRPGPWDLVVEGILVVELDEELHFNRYRASTLRASWSKHLPWTADYRRYCRDHESECLAAGRWGKRWTNASCDRMFVGGAPGDLAGGGAPRWKQRALYDAIKDIAPVSRVALSRLSIYDTVQGVQLGAVLDGAAHAAPSAVVELVRRRVAHSVSSN